MEIPGSESTGQFTVCGTSHQSLPLEGREALQNSQVKNAKSKRIVIDPLAASLLPNEKYIWDTPCLEWDSFKQLVIETLSAQKIRLYLTTGSLNMLEAALVRLYKTPRLDTFVSDHAIKGTLERFSAALTDYAQSKQWSVATGRRLIGNLRHIMIIAKVSKPFYSRVRLMCSSDSPHPVLPTKFGKLAVDDPLRVRLENWIEIIRVNTGMNSHLSVQNMMRFVLHECLPAFSLDLHNWPLDPAAQVTPLLNVASVTTLCANHMNPLARAAWLQVFLRDIVGASYCISAGDKKKLSRQAKRVKPIKEDDKQDGSDYHRIAADDIDKIYQAAKGNTRNELAFMLMISTGMRIGGVVKIKLRSVVKGTDTDWSVSDCGTTIEKGNKNFTFKMISRVRALIKAWVLRERPVSSSPYLFPNTKGGHLSTAAIRRRFHENCLAGGVTGAHIHPHSLRHSYAHILLEAGNPPAIVGALLNHASSATTEKFYLKENIHEVMDRAKMPWIDEGEKEAKRKREPAVPKCLDMRRSKKHKPGVPDRAAIIAGQLSALQCFKPVPAILA